MNLIRKISRSEEEKQYVKFISAFSNQNFLACQSIASQFKSTILDKDKINNVLSKIRNQERDSLDHEIAQKIEEIIKSHLPTSKKIIFLKKQTTPFAQWITDVLQQYGQIIMNKINGTEEKMKRCNSLNESKMIKDQNQEKISAKDKSIWIEKRIQELTRLLEEEQTKIHHSYSDALVTLKCYPIILNKQDFKYISNENYDRLFGIAKTLNTRFSTDSQDKIKELEVASENNRVDSQIYSQYDRMSENGGSMILLSVYSNDILQLKNEQDLQVEISNMKSRVIFHKKSLKKQTNPEQMANQTSIRQQQFKQSTFCFKKLPSILQQKSTHHSDQLEKQIKQLNYQNTILKKNLQQQSNQFQDIFHKKEGADRQIKHLENKMDKQYQQIRQYKAIVSKNQDLITHLEQDSQIMQSTIMCHQAKQIQLKKQHEKAIVLINYKQKMIQRLMKEQSQKEHEYISRIDVLSRQGEINKEQKEKIDNQLMLVRKTLNTQEKQAQNIRQRNIKLEKYAQQIMYAYQQKEGLEQKIKTQLQLMTSSEIKPKDHFNKPLNNVDEMK